MIVPNSDGKRIYRFLNFHYEMTALHQWSIDVIENFIHSQL